MFGADILLLPLLTLLLCVLPGCPKWIAILFLVITILAVLRRVLHAYVFGPIIFPAQNIAKDTVSVFRNMLSSLGTDPALMGEQGILELRSRRDTMITSFPGSRNVRVETPDHVLIEVMHFLTEERDPTAPTCIYFNANMQLLEGASSHNIAHMYLAAGVNLVMFNYRGVCESTGKLTKDGTFIDGESVFQYVTVHCGVPEASVLLHARSIGGGIAAQVAGLHPAVKMCSDRSFSSLLHVIRLSVRKLCKVQDRPAAGTSIELQEDEEAGQIQTQDPPLSCMPMMRSKMVPKARQCMASFLTALAWAIDWDIVAAEAWGKIEGRKWLFYHPEDAMIPLESSLYAAVQEQDPEGHSEFYRMKGEHNGHNRAFTVQEKAWHMLRVAEALGVHAESRKVSRLPARNLQHGALADTGISIRDREWTCVDGDSDSPSSPHVEQAEELEEIEDDTNNLLRKTTV
eukprot:TRINITY_DN12915_c0_g1_i1.p1 TRINITY_DN12915_c0_g1~~TRINITY_DN12915_c0_g1_i1.p1  ORF type:complete len:458 (-),score=113.46 TRINITY_DN12915_c0_g1_i1:164-1537(-)